MGLREMYFEIYEEKQDEWVSEISGKPLTHPYSLEFISQFAHIVSKARSRRLKHEKRNIMCITAEEHRLLDHKGKVSRLEYEKQNSCSFDIFFNTRRELLKELQN